MIATSLINNLDLHLNINDVVYLRLKDDKGECIISAAKYIGWYTKLGCGGFFNVNYDFLLPNGRIHSVTSQSISVYASIEDAINDNKKHITKTPLKDFLRLESKGFTWMRNCIGSLEMCKVLYRWDGYQANEVIMCYWSFDFSRNADLYSYKLREDRYDTETYYNSKEECLNNNKVKVMTF